MNHEAIIDVRDLTKVYPDGTRAVQGVGFQVARGEFFGFLGPNGAGKSTTIKILITLLGKTSGEARVFGQDVDRDAEAIRRRIGYSAQEIGLDDELTGRENLLLQGRLYHLPMPIVRLARIPAACASGSIWPPDSFIVRSFFSSMSRLRDSIRKTAPACGSTWSDSTRTRG
jgi:ABC-type multidrug transport system ATPase subunit